jgi:ubiquitin-protein ligase
VTFNDVILADLLTPLQVEAGKLKGGCSTIARLLTATNVFLANAQISLDDRTFVIVAESRPDVMRALTVGLEDTSYANRLFLSSMLASTNRFDILLPADYPRSPPKIYIKLPYPIMINLNLHPDRKVCLSLLGTWFAVDAVGNWQPGISTILQCLLSIRAMIFVSDSLSQTLLLI